MTSVDLKGHVALVTGASLGIGRATAVALGRAGASVAVNYRSHDEQAEEVVQAIRDAGGQAIKIQTDFADLEAVEAMVEKTVEQFSSCFSRTFASRQSFRRVF